MEQIETLGGTFDAVVGAATARTSPSTFTLGRHAQAKMFSRQVSANTRQVSNLKPQVVFGRD
jgi:hypothetical protein